MAHKPAKVKITLVTIPHPNPELAIKSTAEIIVKNLLKMSTQEIIALSKSEAAS